MNSLKCESCEYYDEDDLYICLECGYENQYVAKQKEENNERETESKTL